MSEAREIRVMFGKRRDPGIVAGRTIPQLLAVLLSVALVVLFVRSITAADGPHWWLLIAAVVVLPLGFARLFGRGLADIGPSLLVNWVMSALGKREYRGGPHRRAAEDSAATPKAQPRLPGPLSALEFHGFAVGDSRGEIGVVFDRVDGTVTVVLAVAGQTFPLLDSGQANAYVIGFQRLLDGLAQAESPIVGLQIMNRILPDLGEDVAREWQRRGGMGSRFSREANEALLRSEVGRGIQHEDYVAIRIDPSKARSQVREYGGGDAGKASLAFRYGSRVERDLEEAGVSVLGWLPPRGIAEVVRSAFDPSADAMVSRRGGGVGDSAGGDGGLPSGVAPVAAEPMFLMPARKYLAHNDHYSRSWWVEEFPRSRQGVPAGFLQPLLLEVPWRHTVSLLLEPMDRREADRRITQAASTQQAKRDTNRKLRRRRTRSDEREEADLDRNEIDLVEGYANYRISVVVTVTAASVRELEMVSADMEAAMNACAMEAKTWYIETDQAFYMGALPLARGVS